MQLDELQSVRDRERQTDKLQQLRASFYEDAGEFIQQLRAERDRTAERADDPFDAPEVNRLTDEIKTAEQTVEAIYEKRVGKIVKAASFAAADLPSEADGMTAEEQELFDQLVNDIKNNREHVLDVLAGEQSPMTPDTETGTGSEAPLESGQPHATSNTAAPEPTAEAAENSPEPPAQAQSRADEPPENTAGDSSRAGVPPEPTDHTPGSRGDPTGSGPADAGHSTPPSEAGDSVSAADVMGGGPDAENQTAGQPSRDPDGQIPPDQPVRKDGGTTAGKPADADSSNPGGGVSDTDSGGPEVRRQTVRITDDVDTFVGFDDRDYDLERNDVVTLPETNADVLVERGRAEHLK